MIKFVPYDIAKLAKKLGFDEECMSYWYRHEKNNGELKVRVGHTTNKYANEEGQNTAAPTYQELIDWLRDSYGLHLYLIPSKYDVMLFMPAISIRCNDNSGWKRVTTTTNESDYYEAYDAGFSVALKVIALANDIIIKNVSLTELDNDIN